jgi:hypothetical protein
MTKKLKKKYSVVSTLVVAVALVVFGGVNWLKAAGEGSVIQNIQNWYGNVEAPTGFSEEGLIGAIEMESGKIVYDNLASSVLQRRTVVVSASQVNGLIDDENGIELIPAVGPNAVIVVQEITGFRRFSSESWSRGAANESFEIKLDNIVTASGSSGAYALGASFSRGFLTGDGDNSIASRAVEVWKPSQLSTIAEWPNGSSTGSSSFDYPTYSSQSAVILSGRVDPSNVETSGITDFVFEVVYRIFQRP